MHVTINGYKTRYVLSAEGKLPWLTLIHPLGGDLSLWDQLSAGFASHYQVLRYDLRGQGRSEPALTTSIADLAADLHALHDALGIKRSHLIGLSLGGMVAQEFALTYPEQTDRLVLCGTMPKTTAADREVFLARAATARADMTALVESTLSRWLTADFRRSHPEAIEQIQEVLEACDPVAYASACEAIARFDVSDRLAKLHAPTLIVTGNTDKGAPLDALAAAIPTAQQLILPGAHLAAIEHPGSFAHAVGAFLAGQPLPNDTR